MRILGVLLLCLAACSDRAAFDRFEPHTGVSVSASDAYLHVIDAVSKVEARVVRLSTENAERFIVKTFVIRSDLNYPNIASAFSLGEPVLYRKDDRHRIGRLRAEAGHLPMSRNQVAARASTGYSFLLGGPRGSYSFNIPPELFAQILKAPP